MTSRIQIAHKFPLVRLGLVLWDGSICFSNVLIPAWERLGTTRRKSRLDFFVSFFFFFPHIKQCYHNSSKVSYSNQIQRWIPACLRELQSSMLWRPALLSGLLKRNKALLLLYPMAWNWNSMKTCWHLTVLLKCWRHLWVCPGGFSRCQAVPGRTELGPASLCCLPGVRVTPPNPPRLQVWPAKVAKLSTNTSFCSCFRATVFRQSCCLTGFSSHWMIYSVT